LYSFVSYINNINPLNAELNPICHLLALVGAHHIFHVSEIRVNMRNKLSLQVTLVKQIFTFNIYNFYACYCCLSTQDNVRYATLTQQCMYVAVVL